MDDRKCVKNELLRNFEKSLARRKMFVHVDGDSENVNERETYRVVNVNSFISCRKVFAIYLP